MSTRRPRVPRVDPALPHGEPARAVAAPGTAAQADSAAPVPPAPGASVAGVAKTDSSDVTSPAPAPDEPAVPVGRSVPAARAGRSVPLEPSATEPPQPVAQPGPPPAAVVDLSAAQQRRDDLHGSGTAAPRTRAPRTSPREAAAARRRRQPLPEPIPARQITGRSLVVLAVLLIAATLVAPTLRTYLNQQLQIAAAQADIAEKTAKQSQYEETIRRWDDPAYVAQQARERLDLVMPGETLYTVTGVPSPAPPAASQRATEEPINTRLPWVEALWDTVVRSAGA